MEPGDAIGDFVANFAGDLDAERTAFFFGFGVAHAFEKGVGNFDAGDFVFEELGVAVADKRPDASYDGDGGTARVGGIEKAEESFGVEDRLGDGIFGAGVDFVEVVIEFAFGFDGAGVGTDTDEDTRGGIDGVAANVDSVVEVVDDLGEAHGVDIEYSGGVGVVAKFRGIAGDDEVVA